MTLKLAALSMLVAVTPLRDSYRGDGDDGGREGMSKKVTTLVKVKQDASRFARARLVYVQAFLM